MKYRFITLNRNVTYSLREIEFICFKYLCSRSFFLSKRCIPSDKDNLIYLHCFVCDELLLVNNPKALGRCHLFAEKIFCGFAHVQCGEHPSTTCVTCLWCALLYLILKYIFTTYKVYIFIYFTVPVQSIWTKSLVVYVTYPFWAPELPRYSI